MNQDKNIIKAVLAVIVAVILGEGVLGWGLYWPWLLVLVEWEGIFWLGLIVGVLLSLFTAMPVGPMSLFVVLVIGVVSILLKTRKGSGWWLVLLSLLINWLFDKVFGLHWSLTEAGGVLVLSMVILKWGTRGDSIRVRYK